VYVAADVNGSTVAKQRSVTVGDTIGNDYAIKSGLKQGEKVIISGIQFLNDGTPIKPLS
jgi:multidrug efflux pump subunit AcrA (membrane-fusion protein)